MKILFGLILLFTFVGFSLAGERTQIGRNSTINNSGNFGVQAVPQCNLSPPIITANHDTISKVILRKFAYQTQAITPLTSGILSYRLLP